MAKSRVSIQSVARGVQLLIGRAVLLAVQDSAKRQLVQFEALKGELKGDVERIQDYGFTSVPLPGAQVVFANVSGNRDHPVAIRVDDPRYRKMGMQPGEVAIYTDEGDYILLKRGNIIEISTSELLVKATDSVRMETPILEVTGEIIDHCDDTGQSMASMRNTYNIHTHNETQTVSHVPNQLMGGL